MASSPEPVNVVADDEPILSESSQRLAIYPIEHHDIWRCYKQQVASFWTAEEIDFSKDREHWQNRLTPDERHFLTSILAFFSFSDTIVSLNLMRNFFHEVRVLEAQVAYTYQAMMENIHAEVYSLMIDVYVTDPEQRRRLFLDSSSLPTVHAKIEWARRWSLADEDAPFALRLVAFAIVEGLFFSGAFCAIYWFKQRNLLPGLTKSNEFIARDEGQHTDFACLLYKKLGPTRLPQSKVHEVFRDAVSIERDFITEAIPCRLIGMNDDLMIQYIEFVADTILVRLGYDTLFSSSNPFPFMDLIGMVGRSNFFEERVSQYQRPPESLALDASVDGCDF